MCKWSVLHPDPPGSPVCLSRERLACGVLPVIFLIKLIMHFLKTENVFFIFQYEAGHRIVAKVIFKWMIKYGSVKSRIMSRWESLPCEVPQPDRTSVRSRASGPLHAISLFMDIKCCGLLLGKEAAPACHIYLEDLSMQWKQTYENVPSKIIDFKSNVILNSPASRLIISFWYLEIKEWSIVFKFW